MIFDHALSVLESTGVNNSIVEYARLSVTRFSMPLFMIASGVVWGRYGLRFKRWAQVVTWAIIINAMTRLLWPDFNFPEILMVWAFDCDMLANRRPLSHHHHDHGLYPNHLLANSLAGLPTW